MSSIFQEISSDIQQMFITYRDSVIRTTTLELYADDLDVSMYIINEREWRNEEEMKPWFNLIIIKNRHAKKMWKSINLIINEQGSTEKLIKYREIIRSYINNKFPRIVDMLSTEPPYIINNVNERNNANNANNTNSLYNVNSTLYSNFTSNIANNERIIFKNANNSKNNTISPKINSKIQENSNSLFSCKMLTTDITNTNYDNFKKKIEEICILIKNEKNEKNVDLDISNFDYERLELNLEVAQRNNLLNTLLNNIHPHNIYMLTFDIENIFVEYENEDGVGQGIVRDYINKCSSLLAEELLESDSRGYYDIKKNLDVDDEIIKFKLFILAYIFGLIICNPELNKFPFRLKRSLLHMCLYGTHPTKDISYFIYQYIEDKDSVNSLVNLLRGSDDRIKNSYLEFPNNTNVNSKNILMFLKQHYFHNYMSKGSLYIGEFFLKSKLSKYLVKNNVNINILSKLLSEPIWNPKIVTDFVKFQVVFDDKVTNEQQIMIKNILLKYKDDEKFFKKLLNFWSASNLPIKDQNYKVTIGDKIYKKGKVCPLPVSHTCFYLLDIPKDIDNQDILEKSILKALDEVGNTFTIAGGNKKKQRQKLLKNKNTKTQKKK